MSAYFISNLKIGIVPDIYVYHDRVPRSKKALKNKTEKLAHFERSIKKRLLNINDEVENDIIKIRQYLIKLTLKSCLKLRYNEAIFNVNKYILLKNMLPKIRISRKKNKVIGLHYLDD